MSDQSGELVLKVAADLGGLRRIQTLIAELNTVAKTSAAGSKNTVAQAAAEMKRLKSAQQAATAQQAKLNAEIAKTGAAATGSLNKAKAGTKGYTRAAAAATKQNQALRGSIRGVSGALGGLWFTYTSILPTVAAFGLAMSLRKAIKDGADFTFQLRAIQGISQATSETIDAAGDSILKLGESSLQGPMELVKGFRILTQAGFSAADALTALPSVSALAVIGQMDLASATVIASGAMHQFSLDAGDMGHITDVLAKTAAVSATTISQVGNALVYTAASAATLDIPLENLSAGIATLATRSVTASKAGTSLNRALLNISAGTPKTKAALAELRVEAFDGTGKFRGMVTVFGEMNKALERYSQKAKVSFLKDILGFRGIKAAPIIEAVDKLKEFIDAAKEASTGLGFANEQLILMSQTAEGQAKLAFNTFEATLIRGAKNAESALFDVANAAREMFKSKEFEQAVTSAVKGIAAFTQGLIKHRDIIIKLGKAYLAFQTIGMVRGLLGGSLMLKAAGGLRLVSKALLSFRLALLISGGGLKGFGIALRYAFSVSAVAPLMAFLATPPGWVAIAGVVAAAAAAMYLFGKRTKEAAAARLPSLKPMLDQMEEMASTKYQSALAEYNKLFNVNPLEQLKGQLSAKVRISKQLLADAQRELAGLASSGEDNSGEFGGLGTEAADLVRIAQVKERIASLEAQIYNWQRSQFIVQDELGGAAKLQAKIEAKRLADKKEAEGTKQRVEAPGKAIKAIMDTADAEVKKANLVSKARFTQAKNEAKVHRDSAQLQVADTAARKSHADDLLTIEITAKARLSAVKTRGDEDIKAKQEAFDKLELARKEQQVKDKLKADENYYTALGKMMAKSEAGEKKDTKALGGVQAANRISRDSSGIRGYLEPFIALREKRIKLNADYTRKEAEINKQITMAEGMKAGKEQQEVLTQLNSQKEGAEQLHQEKLTQITNEEGKKRKALIIDQARSAMASTASILGSIADLIGDGNKEAFERSKEFRIAQATMDMVAGAAGAFADTHGHIAIRIAAGIAAAAAGAVRLQQIRQTEFQGQAHDGLPEIPNTGTYLLERGERVVKKEDNQKLQRFLDGGGGSQQPTQVSVNITAVDAPSVANLLASNEGLIQRLVQNGYNQRLATGGPLR